MPSRRLQMKTIHFTTGMPRAGTTLFQNILAQNPKFYASGTSGVLELLYASRANFTNLSEFKAQDVDLMDKAFKSYCKYAVSGWYEGLTDRPVCFDKSRGWVHYYEFLSSFIENPKVFLIVRDIRGCLSSMEKKFRKNMFRHDNNDKPGELKFISVEDRVNTWVQNPPAGLAIKRIYGAIQRGVLNGGRVHIVRFEDLSSNPEKTMKRAYQYLGEDYYNHDFNNVQQFTIENDGEFGQYGDHKIKPVVKPIAPDWKEILGGKFSDSIVASHQWFYDSFYPEVK